MNYTKNICLCAGLVLSTLGLAQNENVLLDRSFWTTHPDLATLKQKIDEGNDATALNANGFDAIVYGLLEHADDAVIKHLLSIEGNPIDKRTHDSRIYLHWAAYAGQTGMVNFLLDQGSSVTALDSHAYTPLAFAANAGQKSPQLYEAFENHGVELTDEKDERGANLLLLVAPALENEEELNYFISKGLDPASTDNEGNGIFNYASKKGNIEFLRLLVDKGLDYKTLNNNGGNAILFAAQGTRGYSNPLAVYKYLQDLGLDPNVVTKAGNTPLQRLAYNNSDPEIFNFFLAAGADVNQADAEGNTAFLNAASQNDLEIVELLAQSVKDYQLKNNNGQTALMLAVERNSPQVVAFLLKNDSDASAIDNNGNSLAYYLAASFDMNQPESFNEKLKLLENEKVLLNTTQAEGNTLNHLAVKDNNMALLKRLAEYDIPVNAKNDEGLTALHLAAMKAEDDQMMKYLISIGADPQLKTDFDETVYDLASENELLKKENVALNFLDK